MADLYGKEDDKGSSGLNINARPGSIDPIATQRTIFPLEAFEFSDPNRTDEPALTMKDPWSLVASGLILYENGVDKDNLQEGDRRLIADGAVLKLQHWDGTQWVDDISLGGYDDLGNFTDFLVARGIIRSTEGVASTESGFGITFSSGLRSRTHYDFCGFNSQPLKIGESDLYDELTMEEAPVLFHGKPTWQPL